MTTERMMTIAELSEILRITPGQLYRKRALGDDLPPQYEIGGRVLFRQSEVDDWIEGRRAAPRVAS